MLWQGKEVNVSSDDDVAAIIWQRFLTFRYIGITAFPLEEFHKVPILVLKGSAHVCISKVLDITKTKVDTILTYAKNILVNSSLQVNANIFFRHPVALLTINFFQEHLPYFQSKRLGVINASPTGLNQSSKQWGVSLLASQTFWWYVW